MTSEKRICQNCKTEFVIDAQDFEFYGKIKVPSRSWCFDCMLQRRLVFRNERTLYRGRENFEGKSIISMYPEDTHFKVYEHQYWWSDEWDPLEYGKDYDFSRPFFDQFKELIVSVPWPALLNLNAINSEYCNYTTDNKNCYLVFGGDFNEDCMYSTFNFDSRDSLGLHWVDRCELCYEVVDSENCHGVVFSKYASDCTDSAFLFNCVNCNDCLGCVNLRNKSYHIFNKPYSKEEYEQKLNDHQLNTFAGIDSFRAEFNEFLLKYPRKYADISKSVDSTGDNLNNVKNCRNCFDVSGNVEDSSDFFLGGWVARDVRSADHVRGKVELVYDSLAVFSGSNNIAFSLFISSSSDIQYSYNCHSSQRLFGCAGLKSKQYCILNEQYSKDEYVKLVPKIIHHMNEMPYTDNSGKVYKYGEFFPPELSPFAYNETVAQEYFPLTKEKAAEKGYKWRDSDKKESKYTERAKDLPDNIQDVSDDILNQTLECLHQGTCNERCTTVFRIIPQELEFYRKQNIPLPRLCPNCRHYQRIKQRNPLKLWHRKCTCAGEKSDNGVYQNTVEHFHKTDHCPNEFETSYAPDRPEIVYCEQCYNTEVV